MNGITEFDPINALTTLLTGPGADNFRKLEAIADVFCPFEAIGMTQQEIRHAHYLAYLLDPHRPHGFGDKFLSETVRLFADTAGKSAPSPLYLHLADLGQARILRERDDIDLRIEIPKSGAMHKNCVFIIEMKIGADEGKGQLEKYEKIAKAQYDGWDIVHVFLTPEASEASREDWTPVGFHALLEAYETRLTRENLTGEPANLLRAWIAMLRRHVLQNEELENLITAIWREHGEALDLLMEHRPDFTLEALHRLSEDAQRVAEELNEKLNRDNLYVEPEKGRKKSFPLFAIPAFDDHREIIGPAGKWRSDSSRLMAIGVFNTSRGIKTSLIIGKGTEEKFRHKIREQFKGFPTQHNITNKVWSNPGYDLHLANKELVPKEILEKLTAEQDPASAITEALEDAFVDHWSKNLPEAAGLLDAALTK
ncbi:MAG TPA: hypothetical protein ENK28_11095 [Aliiroseovarius sp.]|nr:hypothetical protein [Aliiroseovarius sp.]